MVALACPLPALSPIEGLRSMLAWSTPEASLASLAARTRALVDLLGADGTGLDLLAERDGTAGFVRMYAQLAPVGILEALAATADQPWLGHVALSQGLTTTGTAEVVLFDFTSQDQGDQLSITPAPWLARPDLPEQVVWPASFDPHPAQLTSAELHAANGWFALLQFAQITCLMGRCAQALRWKADAPSDALGLTTSSRADDARQLRDAASTLDQVAGTWTDLLPVAADTYLAPLVAMAYALGDLDNRTLTQPPRPLSRAVTIRK